MYYFIYQFKLNILLKHMYSLGFEHMALNSAICSTGWAIGMETWYCGVPKDPRNLQHNEKQLVVQNLSQCLFLCGFYRFPYLSRMSVLLSQDPGGS